jgi:hypothetical protein
LVPLTESFVVVQPPAATFLADLNSNHRSLKNVTAYANQNPGLVIGQAQQCDGVAPVNGLTISSIDNMIN